MSKKSTTPVPYVSKTERLSMKRETGKWVRKAEDDWQGAQIFAARKPPLRNLASFHCQQAAEKHLKALLQENGVAIPKINDLESILDLLLPNDATLASLRRILQSLSSYAVDYYDPNMRTTTRQMTAALRRTERVRGEVRRRLGLPL